MELADDSAIVGIQDNQNFPSTSSADNNLSDSLPSISSDAETQHFSEAAPNNSNENSIQIALTVTVNIKIVFLKRIST